MPQGMMVIKRMTAMTEMFGMSGLPLWSKVQTCSVSPENPTGKKGCGAMATPYVDNMDVPLHETSDYLGRGWKNRPFITVKAGECVDLLNVEGPGVIQHMWLLLWNQPQSDYVPKEGILRFYWDGEEVPSVESPAGMFFAVGERFAKVCSMPVVVNTKNALNSYWPMPFRKHARISFENTATEDIVVFTYQITYAKCEVDADAMYFHARHHHAFTGDENPYVLLEKTEGCGKYVGSVLSVHALDDGWFGEGEFKFYIDGDNEFPSICGTGMEDYFLCTYGMEAYCAPFSGVPLMKQSGGKEQFLSGDVAIMYRWHIMDPIFFEKDIKVTVQALGPIGGSKVYKKRRDLFSSVAYWYQKH